MQIKRLELAGFKSFMNPVQLDFGGGITAILGPNGCGKSNVVDSLRWVLGEQSAKQLRGDKMMNVVFGGTRLRPSLGMAEVSVSFHNGQGRMPVPFQEVRLTRRLSRDGTSEYLLNGAPCRLKDIKDLITDTGAGSHAYSIIEREMVDGVINGHEDSRRFLFEEASGIMKYRLRRKEAQRKLELTQQDLLRLDDIIEEIARQVRSLRRQMGRARRYRELQAELRRAETYLAQQKLREYSGAAAALEVQLAGMQAVDLGEDAESDAIGARIEALRAELLDIERDSRRAGEAASALAGQLKQSEESILVLGGRLESTRTSRAAAAAESTLAEQRLAQAQADRFDLESQRAGCAGKLESEHQMFQARKEELAACETRHEQARSELWQVKQRSFGFAQDSATRRGELEVLRSKLAASAARAGELREELRLVRERGAELGGERQEVQERAAVQAVARQAHRAALVENEAQAARLEADLETRRTAHAESERRLESRRAKRDMLHAMVAEHEGYGEGARALLGRHASGGPVLGTLAEHVVAPDGLESAFDALLHDVMDALVVRDLDAALDLVRELRGEGLGRATFLPSAVEGGAEEAALRQVCTEIAGVVGPAADLLPDAGPAAGVVRRLLARSVVVEDAAAARAVLSAVGDAALRVATRDGLLFTGGGAVRGGSETRREVRLLGRRQRLQELESDLQQLERQTEEMRLASAALEVEVHVGRERRRELEDVARVEEERYHALSMAAAGLESSLAGAATRQAQLESALAHVETEGAALAGALPGLSQAAENLSVQGDEHNRTLAEMESAFAALDRERDRLRLEVGELRVAYVTLQGEAESRGRQLERLAELEMELGDLRGRRLEEIARADQDEARYTAELKAARERAAGLVLEVESARAAQVEVSRRLEAQRAGIDAEQARLHAVEKTRREEQGRRHATEMELAGARLHLQNLLERMQENYQIDAAGLTALKFDWSDAEPLPDEARLRQLRDDLAHLGPVNLLALEEHGEKSDRLRFLSEQRDDLAKASASLQETIEKINRTAHFLFMETFEQIRGHFRDTIRTVFDGGEGDLVLADPQEPLETDIEILVRPRGKKIDTLTQLSSGERALTAIALLFSIYLVKPSPFCVFDEVDAPLDDANIGRFVHLLQEFKDRTQFVVITHNKLTMEAADRLYGVTMEEEGVSKLVSVALDGNLRCVPQPLQKKVRRAARAAAVLAPAAGAPALDTVQMALAIGAGDERPAARVEPLATFAVEAEAAEAGSFGLEPEPAGVPVGAFASLAGETSGGEPGGNGHEEGGNGHRERAPEAPLPGSEEPLV